eukprot:10652064-Ditylum_brightwellii.AAC.1
MSVPTYNIGTKPKAAGFPSNQIDLDGESMTSSVPSTTSFHVITEEELKEKNMPYQAHKDTTNCDISS